jgi:cell division protein FtsW (lipid II flippase)
MEVGTAIFVVAIIGFMIASPGFLRVVLALGAIIFLLFIFVEQKDAARREQTAAAEQIKRCQNFFAGPEDGCNDANGNDASSKHSKSQVR